MKINALMRRSKLISSSLVKTQFELETLFQKLSDKKLEGFVFRGQADAKWQLEPNNYSFSQKKTNPLNLCNYLI